MGWENVQGKIEIRAGGGDGEVGDGAGFLSYNDDVDWRGKKVAVLGWGIDTQDVEPWLRRQGARTTILDEKDDKNAFADLSRFEVLVRSPGVYRYRPEILAAERAGVVVTSKMKIFFDVCPTKNIVGVTGTKGKGTTSTLIYEILKADGREVYLGGNIGKGCFEFLDKLNQQSWVVLELSSFQLVDLHKSPYIAVTLMVTADHLDWHRSIDEYVEAKAAITKHQGPGSFSVFNDQYPNSVRIGRQGGGQKVAFNREQWVWPKRLRGEHNKENFAAALAVARLLGIDEEIVRRVAREFKGLEHRLEEVATVNGVTYFDDSISTTPETAIAAIESFAEPMVLILGGSDKGADYTELGRVIAENKKVKAVILIGLMAEKIEKTIVGREVELVRGLRDMGEVVRKASELAKPGEVVVLSPACASFDMFKDYKDRGEQFKRAVLSLKG